VTAPALAEVDKATGLRVYRDPKSPEPLPSVTSLISLARAEGLERWKRLQVARLAVGRADLVRRRVSELGVEATIRRIVAAAEQAETSASRIGDEVHGYLEARARGEVPPPVSDEARRWLRGAEQFLDAFQPDFLAVEATVFHRTLGYAGTADFLAVVGGTLVIGDYKTGKAVHGEVALQLVALSRAEVLVEADGAEQPMPEVETGLVVHLRPELPEGYAVRRVELAEAPWERFAACLALWKTREVQAFVGEELTGPDELGCRGSLAGPVAHALS
jgi:hypothetical protein